MHRMDYVISLIWMLFKKQAALMGSVPRVVLQHVISNLTNAKYMLSDVAAIIERVPAPQFTA